MRNTFDYFDEGIYLAHHGIKGQKWGIRRYQNPDGSLTSEGKARYGKELSDGVKKADLKGDTTSTIQAVHRTLDKNKAVNNFEKTNETAASLRKAHSDINEINTRLNLQINNELEKKYGRPFVKLPLDKQIAYYQDGKNLFKERATKEGYEELIKKYEKLSKDYEQESREFLKDLLGEYGNETLKSNWAIKYNFVTKEISKQTITDLAGIEMLRRAGGKI